MTVVFGITREPPALLTLAAIRAEALANRGGLHEYVVSLTDDLDLPDRHRHGPNNDETEAA